MMRGLAEAVGLILAAVPVGPVGHRRAGKWRGYRPPRGLTYQPNGTRECARRMRQAAAIAERRAASK